MPLTIERAEEIYNLVIRTIDSDSPERLTHGRVKSAPDEELPGLIRDPEFGSDNDDDPYEGRPRQEAYLRAWLALAGDRLPMSGIPVATGYIHLDKGVVKSLWNYDLITLDDEDLILTPEGRNFLAGGPTQA